MEKIILLAAIFLASAFTGSAQNPTAAYKAKLKSLYKGTVPVVQPADLAGMLAGPQPPIVLDTRSPEEFGVSHIAGAQFVDYKGFKKEMANGLDRKRPVVVYCTVGYRSERIGEQLQKLGFKTVHNLYGGIFEWVNEGHPVVDAQGKVTPRVHAYSQDWGQWLLKGEKVYE
jgi:rhodanese-related sulfurtransferase